MKPILALLALSLATAGQSNAQAGRDSRGDGADARTDALLGTPNKVTPVPQVNRFSTSPGLEQQAPGPYGKDQPRGPGAPGAPRSPAGTQP
jgi:hypothetical protein